MNQAPTFLRLVGSDLDKVRSLMVAESATIPNSLRSALWRLIDSGGKRLRPSLVLLYGLMAGAEAEATRLAAAGVEMLHTATLVHDDLIDGAQRRRGIETLNVSWSSTATVLSGDAMFALAAKLIARTHNTYLAFRFAETLESICSGELKQMLSRNGRLPTVGSYRDRIYAKTASLFSLCAEVGPILADLGPEAAEEARVFGRLLGEAFQITDDVLDIVGDPDRLGKPVGSDLRQGLATMPVILYGRAHPEDERLTAALGHRADDAVLGALIADVRRSDAADQATALAKDRVDQAVALLTRYPDTEHKRALVDLAHFASVRRF